MPSPPASVSSRHQPAAAEQDAGSDGVREHVPGHREQFRVGGGQPGGDRQVPGVRPPGVRRALGPEHGERREPHPVEALHRPAVPLVGGAECRRRWRAGTWSARAGPPAGQRRRPARVNPPRVRQHCRIRPAVPARPWPSRPPADPRLPRQPPGRLLKHGHRGGQRRAGGRADRGVLVAQQLPRLGRPRQQLGVEQQPGRRQLVEQAGRHRGGPDPVNQRRGERRPEERPPGPRPRRAGPHAGGDAEAGHRVGLRPAHQHDGPRPHVLLLAHDVPHAGVGVGGERLRGVLKQLAVGRGGYR